MKIKNRKKHSRYLKQKDKQKKTTINRQKNKVRGNRRKKHTQRKIDK